MKHRTLLTLAALAVLAGCGTITPKPLSDRAQAGTAASWQAPIPATDTIEAKAWWTAWSDPALARMLEAAQRANPTLEQSIARLEQARGAVQIAEAARYPSFDLTARFSRGRNLLIPPGLLINSAQLLIDMVWEADLWGSQRAGADAARARASAREADWHDGSVSLAAEVASTHVSLIVCRLAVELAREDLRLLADNAKLIAERERAGFAAGDTKALGEAQVSEAETRLTNQREQCDLAVKAQTMLTGLPEGEVRAVYAARDMALPAPKLFTVAAIPASALSQRPDLASIERNLAATSLDVGVAEVASYPKLGLNGQVGRTRAEAPGFSVQGNNWSIGPQITAPLIDFGRKRGNIAQARARYRELEASFRQRAQLAVREVEEALVRLDAANQRRTQSAQAVARYTQALNAAQDRLRTGLGNAQERNDAARSLLNARGTEVTAERDRLQALVSLYKAVGGGWSAADAVASNVVEKE